MSVVKIRRATDLLDIPTEPPSLPYDTFFSLPLVGSVLLVSGLFGVGGFRFFLHLLGFFTFLFTIGAGYTQTMSIVFFQSSYLNFSRLIGWFFLLFFVIDYPFTLPFNLSFFSFRSGLYHLHGVKLLISILRNHDKFFVPEKYTI